MIVGKSLRKSWIIFTALALLGVVWAGGLMGADDVLLNPFFKEAPKGIGEGVPPNVFLLIDTSASMLWSTSGDVNDVPASGTCYSGPAGSSPYYVLPSPVPHNPVVGDPYYFYESSETWCTYGDGSQPYKMYTGEQYQYWGRDLDSSNNIENDPNCYAQDNDYLRYKRGNRANGLVPNDSRAFKMKLVLWRLLRSPDVVRDAVVGVATYVQQDYSSWGDNGLPWADWYRGVTKSGSFAYREASWPNGRFGYDNPNSSGTGGSGMTYYGRSVRLSRGVLISTNESSKRAMFIVQPSQMYQLSGGAYVATQARDKVTQWFDGVEDSTNKELRFDGKRPLTQSIAFSEGANYSKLEGSLRDFFCARKSGVYDINDSRPSAEPTYIRQWCQGNYAIILTAGGQNRDNTDPVEAVRALYNARISYYGWGVDPATGSYRKSQPVKVFVVAFVNPNPTSDKGRQLKRTLEKMADVGDDGLENGSASPFYANDVGALMDAFRRIFDSINSNAGSGGAPVVSPRKDGETFVYSSSFSVPSSSRAMQWKGDIVCYGFDKDGNQTRKWSAAEMLNKREHSDRALLAVVNGEGLKRVLNSGSFSYLDQLASQMGLSSSGASAATQAELFLRWLMGDRTVAYDANGFKIKWDEDLDENYLYKRAGQRYKMGDVYHSGMVELTIYNSNGGKDIALFAQDNLGLLHAFDVSNGSERWAFAPPNVLEGRRMVGLKQFQGAWLQTTDPMQSYYSVPRYLLDGPLVVERTREGKYVLLGLLGRGGCGLYAMDVTSPWSPSFLWAVENQVFEFKGDSSMPGFSSSPKLVIWGSKSREVLSHVQAYGTKRDYRELLLSTSTPVVGTYLGEDVLLMGNGYPGPSGMSKQGAVYLSSLFTGDIKNKFTHSDMKSVVGSPKALAPSDGSREIDLFYFGDLSSSIWRASASKGQVSCIVPSGVIPGGMGISHGLAIGRSGGALWIAGVTGDDGGLDNPSGTRAVMFSFPLARAESGGITKTGDLNGVNAYDQSTAGSTDGWYMPLDQSGANRERPSTPPVIKNGYALFATFTPSSGACVAGTGRLYAVDLRTGKSGWGGLKYREVENLKITGITIYKNKIYMGVQRFADISDSALKKAFGSDAKASWDSGLVTISLPPNVPADKDKVGKYDRLYWRRR